ERDPMNFMLLPLDAGRQRIALEFTTPREVVTGRCLTAFTLLFILAWLCRRRNVPQHGRAL
ncbi:MAG TPA: hypothetical protein VHN20_08460, partial [Beijerinckiaceae bacterium]|nr:hypothetical protein [Beijerinckiaceae bacterium]